MDEKIEVCGAPVIFTTEKPPPYNPLKRPAISYKKPIVCLLLLAAGIVALSFLPGDFFIKKWMAITGYILLMAVLLLKKTLIWCVHLYQNKASDKTRLRCVFEPSCSEYMILAIEKYGVAVGVVKRIRRLLRCHPPNGGVDYP